ncbi:MAG: hypothetical protein ACREUJ_09240 [Burkholderiales bacterium]
MLKHIVFTLGTVFALSFLPAAFAADQGQKQTDQKGDQAQKFQEYKQHMLERIDHRIAALQKARGCVAQAQDKHALKECRPEHKHEGDHHRDRDHHDRDRDKS